MSMTISIDDDLKREFSEVCREIGLPPSTAFGIFAKAVVRERAIPFALSAVSASERAAHAYDLAVSDGIRRGWQQVRCSPARGRGRCSHREEPWQDPRHDALGGPLRATVP